MTDAPILPGATIGVLGSGQLGRMFAMAARRLGYRINVLSPDSDSPAGQVADREVVAHYEDLDAIRAFARDVKVVTFEFENVPAATADALARYFAAHPEYTVGSGGERRFLTTGKSRQNARADAFWGGPIAFENA